MDTHPRCSYCGESKRHLNGCPSTSLTPDVDRALWSHGKEDKKNRLEPRSRDLAYLLGYDPRLAKQRHKALLDQERAARARQSPPVRKNGSTKRHFTKRVA